MRSFVPLLELPLASPFHRCSVGGVLWQQERAVATKHTLTYYSQRDSLIPKTNGTKKKSRKLQLSKSHQFRLERWLDFPFLKMSESQERGKIDKGRELQSSPVKEIKE